MNTEPQPVEKPTTYRSDGPFGALLNHIPLQSRFAMTIGVLVAVFASVAAGGLAEVAGQIALGCGLVGGVIVAIVLAVRSHTNRAR